MAGRVAARGRSPSAWRPATPAALAAARRRFLASSTASGVPGSFGIMQRFWYVSRTSGASASSDLCRDRDVQKLTFDSYMNKELVRARPGAHMRIFFKDIGHLLGFLRP
jgi:geranylgeranyl reductase